MEKDRHVVPHDDGWAVRKPGSERVSSIHRTQHAAINKAIRGAKADKSEVVIHGMNGKIRDKDSYGPDSCPPRDTKY